MTNLKTSFNETGSHSTFSPLPLSSFNYTVSKLSVLISPSSFDISLLVKGNSREHLMQCSTTSTHTDFDNACDMFPLRIPMCCRQPELICIDWSCNTRTIN